jgi:hypothetical protein
LFVLFANLFVCMFVRLTLNHVSKSIDTSARKMAQESSKQQC